MIQIKFLLRNYQDYLGRRIYILFVLTLLAAVMEGFGITLILPLLQAFEVGNESKESKAKFLFDIIEWMGISGSITGILIFIITVFFVKGILKFFEGFYKGYLQRDLMRRLKGNLFDLYSTVDYQFFTSRNTGHFINVINGQVNKFIASFNAFALFSTQIITAASYFGIAFFISWKFTAMAVGVGVIIQILFRLLNKYLKKLSRLSAAEASTLNKFLVQTLHAFKYIIATNKIFHLRKGILGSIHRFTGYQFKFQIANAFTTAIKEPISILFIVAIIIVQVVYLNEPIASVFAILMLFHRGMGNLLSIQGHWQSVMQTVGSVEMVDNEFEEVRTHQIKNGKKQLDEFSDAIKFDDVSFSYGKNEVPVIKNISLEIPGNAMVAFVGESGAGKTTLVDMIPLLIKPDNGHLYMDGISHEKLELRSWRSQIGYVSQESVVFDDTIANNISLWTDDRSDTSRQKIIAAAKKAHAHKFIMQLSDGYETLVGDRGVRLSGGQKQRLFIARELFKEPKVLLLDEATSALDTESEKYIQQSIDDLKGKMTVVLIAHRLSTIKDVDKIYVMDQGRIIEEGSYAALTNGTDSRFKAMVELQSL